VVTSLDLFKFLVPRKILVNWLQRLQIWCTGWMWKSQPTDNKLSLIGTWSGHVTHYKVLGAPIISLERLNLKSNLYTS